MEQFLTATLEATAAFIATNIDDIVVLMVFFSQVDASFRAKNIITGQYLGFAVLILLSLPGFFGGLLIPQPWIALLGIVPIWIGISQLFSRKEEEVEIQTIIHEIDEESSSPLRSFLAQFINPQVYKVAGVTIANGGDNIGTYVPLFAGSNWLELIVILLVFFILVGVWCWLASQLVQHRSIAPFITRYGQAIVPFVLIGLGIYILIDNRVAELRLIL